MFALPEGTNKVKLAISNAEGEEIYNTTLQGLKPTNKFIWDGKNNQGKDVDIGQYNLTISTVDSKSGASSYIASKLVGTVDSITNVNGHPYLGVSGVLIDSQDITSVKN